MTGENSQITSNQRPSEQYSHPSFFEYPARFVEGFFGYINNGGMKAVLVSQASGVITGVSAAVNFMASNENIFDLDGFY